jgi:16S rRNA pseudouridine516 synthase
MLCGARLAPTVFIFAIRLSCGPPWEADSVRLDRYLSRSTGLSRSQARKRVRGGRVELEGRIVTDPSYIVGNQVAVFVDGDRVNLPRHCYLMLHKPAGHVCDRGDARHPSVFDLLGDADTAGLHAAGRLDADVTGLVLLTDDGDWSHALTAPRRGHTKVYRVVLAEDLGEMAAAQLRTGVQLRGEPRPTRPAGVERLARGEVRLTIHEGRYHQVKRMFAAVGNHVTALHRERVGPFVLDPRLAAGDWRHLEADEVAQVQTPGRKL